MMKATLPWYKSPIMVGMLVSLLGKIAVISGFVTEVSDEDAAQVTNLIVLVASGLADLWAMRARLQQKSAPKITLRKGLSDV
jgi:hypothetical protein